MPLLTTCVSFLGFPGTRPTRSNQDPIIEDGRRCLPPRFFHVVSTRLWCLALGLPAKPTIIIAGRKAKATEPSKPATGPVHCTLLFLNLKEMYPPPLSLTPFSSYTHILHQKPGLVFDTAPCRWRISAILTPPPVDDAFALSMTRRRYNHLKRWHQWKLYDRSNYLSTNL